MILSRQGRVFMAVNAWRRTTFVNPAALTMLRLGRNAS